MSDKNNFQFASKCCWTDGSGFEWDGEPFNLIGFTPNSEQFFSLTGRMAKNNRGSWQLWSNWIDKFQTDYRFLLLSDENAETILQPNVDDPWMFTEYIFKGIGKRYNSNTGFMEEVECLIVEPPLYDEESLTLKNPDRIFPENINPSDYDSFKNFDIKNECADYNRDRIISKDKVYVKACRTINENGWGDGYSVNDPGAKLYKVSVNVESVKWGEHGNIPPHTLNMYAPSSWLDTKVKKTIQPITIAKIGYPVFATIDGVFFHDEDNNDYIFSEINWTKEEGSENLTKFYYSVPTNKEGGELQPKGNAAGNASKNEMNLKYIQQSANGDLIHKNGCEFFVGKGGCAYCTAADKNDMNFTNSLVLDKEICFNGEKSVCPKFIKNSPKPISTYETIAQSKDQYLSATYGMYASNEEKRASNLLKATDAMGPLLGGAGAVLAFGVLSSTPTVYQPGLRDYTQSNVYFETSFQITETPLENFKIEPENIKDFGKGVKVVRGSGNQNIDNIIPWKGGDSYAVGDADQINFARFTQSVMPCYNPDYCNELCGLAMQSGYSTESRANSKTENSPETNSQYIDYCRYYKSKNSGVECPFDSIPKTAYEFQQAKLIGKNSIEEEINRWINNYNYSIELNNIVFEENTMFVRKIESEERSGKDNIPEHYILYGKQNFSSRFGGLNCSQEETVKIKVPKKDENNSFYYDENGLLACNEEELEAYKICKFTLTSTNPSVAKIDDLYFWWTPLDNNGKKLTKTIIEDGIEKEIEVVWFCKFEENVVVSTHFTHYVDNWNKFIGGAHPFYKDYSKRGGEYLQEKESQTERDAMGDLGGDPEYSGIEQPKTKQGYWIDEDGEWIMDELSLGELLNYDENDEELPKISRTIEKTESNGITKEKVFNLTDKEYEVFNRKNERENTQGVSLSFRKSNTIIDENGQTQSPQTINCTININDTRALVEALYHSPPVRFNESDKPVQMPPSVSIIEGLPAERMGAYCKVCDYYLNEKYGIDDNEKGLICPWCGSELKLKPIRKLHKLKSIGKVDYWGLPGTVIDSKSYFWKNPTLINNSILDQIKFKAKNNGTNANSDSEITNGYIKDYKGYYKPIPSQEEVLKMPEEERKKLWEIVKDKDRKDISSYNDLIEKINTSTNGFDVSDTDDRLIVPYSDNDGLKFFTLNHLKKLRKSVEPALGYTIGSYPSNPDFNRMRPTYENRNDATAPRYWVKGKCGVQPQILAANSAGNDCYIQYWSGDPERGSVRDYYPPGPTWWLLNNVMGIRYSDNLGSRCHLDDGSYGSETHSMMCCFLHGFIPMNKKILAAYAIIYPSSVYPSREPLGRDWNGRIHYEHYHAFSKFQERNSSGHYHELLGDHLHKRAGFKEHVFDNVGEIIPWSAVGQGNENLYKAIYETTNGKRTRKGWIPGAFTSEDKNSFEGMKFDDNGVPHYIPIRPKEKNNYFIHNENIIGEFKDDGRYPEWLSIKDKLITKNKYQSYYDFGEEEMAEATSDLNHYFDENWWGKLEGGLPVWDYIKLDGQYEGEFSDDEEGNQIFIPSDKDWKKWGKDIIQLKTNNEIWKQMTSDEFDEYLEYNVGNFNFSCSDGEIETSYDFSSINNDLIVDFFPEQMQEIPGYFKYNGMNTSGHQNKNIQSKKPEVDEKWRNEQILYQEETRGTGILKKEEYEECGNLPMVLDITNVVKNTYNKRIECEFNCEAGKSIEEVFHLRQTQEESRWEGIGSDFNEDERKLWNTRYLSEGCGVLLSDYFHYPKTNSEGDFISSNDGDKIELNTICQSDIFSSLYDFENGRTIDSNNDEIILEIIKSTSKEKTTVTLKLPHSNNETVTFEDYCKEIETIINSSLKEDGITCNLTTLKNERWIISFKNTFSFSLSGSAIEYIGGIEKEYISISNRIISVTSSLEGYTPINLIKGDKTTCEPIKNDGWKTESFNDNPQSFIIDLLQTPYETHRRDWRYRSGSKNCMNCYCPNENCITNLYYHPNRVTVGTWAAKKNLSMGNGQTTCPSCGTDLSNEDGVIATDSDGIKSYYYDEEFNKYSFIKKIIISPHKDDLFKCDFNLYYQNPDSGIWICFLSATKKDNSDTYTYYLFGKEYENSKNEKFEINTGSFRSRYIKVETINKHKRVSYEGTCKKYENKIIIDYIKDIDVDALIGQAIRFGEGEEAVPEWEISEETTDEIKIISNYIENDELVIKLNKYPPSNKNNFRFYANKYYGGIGTFEVYGIPFKESEMTIVPPPEYEIGKISDNGLTLSQQPIQIMSVCVGSANGRMIYLEEHDKHIDSNKIKNTLFYEVEEKFYTNPKNQSKILYYEIVSGNFYHEPKSNKIFVPTKIKINNELLPVEYLTKNLEDNGIYLKNNEVNQVVVEYWSNSNKGVTLKASAAEMGPAYQLEIESICKIKNQKNLPKCGKSVKLFTSDDPNKTERKDIEWFCYNHVPSTLKEENQTLLGGYFKKPNFYGMELGKLTQQIANRFKTLFGKHCTKISPRCFTEVTFYGRPNTILSGNIVAYAPKENKITYSFPNSENLTITEQTGGFADGMFVLEIKKGSSKDRGRKTKTWDRPLIVVYAEDEEPFSNK